MASLDLTRRKVLRMFVIVIISASVVQAAQRDSGKAKEINIHTPNSSTQGGAGGNGGGGGGGSSKNNIEFEETRNGPYFDKAASKNVTALLGKTAYLNCRVKNLGNKTMLLQVSWVRHRDIHLLTVGRYTYTSDQRFRAIHHPHTDDWILQIKYPQHRDSGIYECQVSTTPHMSHYIHLNVIEPSTEIIGAPDLYIESGSTINLTCVILNSPEPPAYIFWNHNNAIINYDSPRGGVSVVTIKGETTTSFLLIKNARPSDSGQYQCNPSNAKSKSVAVHVLNGVSHSVSRGIPSSNAARGSSASSDVTKSLPFSLSINLIIYISIYQASTFHKSFYTLTKFFQSFFNILLIYKNFISNFINHNFITLLYRHRLLLLSFLLIIWNRFIYCNSIIVSIRKNKRTSIKKIITSHDCDKRIIRIGKYERESIRNDVKEEDGGGDEEEEEENEYEMEKMKNDLISMLCRTMQNYNNFYFAIMIMMMIRRREKRRKKRKNRRKKMIRNLNNENKSIKKNNNFYNRYKILKCEINDIR